jgi:hypothetical protein
MNFGKGLYKYTAFYINTQNAFLPAKCEKYLYSPGKTPVQRICKLPRMIFTARYLLDLLAISVCRLVVMVMVLVLFRLRTRSRTYIPGNEFIEQRYLRVVFGDKSNLDPSNAPDPGANHPSNPLLHLPHIFDGPGSWDGKLQVNKVVLP